MRSLPRIPVDLETSAHPPAASPVTGQRARVGNAGDNPQMSVTLGNRDRALVDFLFRTLEPQPISFGRLNRALDPAAARGGRARSRNRTQPSVWLGGSRTISWLAATVVSSPATADCGCTVITTAMPGAARESRLRVDGEDGCGASDEREGNSRNSEKLLHGVFPSLNGLSTCDCHRPPKWSVTDSTKRRIWPARACPWGSRLTWRRSRFRAVGNGGPARHASSYGSL